MPIRRGYRPNHKVIGESKPPQKYYCENPDCNNEIPEPIILGSDDVGAGQPAEPPVCSDECLYICYPHLKEEE